MSSFDSSDLRRVIEKRHEFLQLMIREPLDKPDLEAQLEMSRSTIDYAIRELLQFNLVNRTPNGFAATLFGQLVYTAYEEYDQTLEGHCEAFDVLKNLAPNSISDPRVFKDATVIKPGPNALDKPLRVLIEHIRNADKVRCMTPVILEPFIEIVYDRTINGGKETEVILSSGAFRYLATTYIGQCNELIHTDNFSFYELSEEFPFGLVITERGNHKRVGVIVFDDSGIRGLINNTNEQAVAWGEQLYQQQKEEAQHVFVRGSKLTLN